MKAERAKEARKRGSPVLLKPPEPDVELNSDDDYYNDQVLETQLIIQNDLECQQDTIKIFDMLDDAKDCIEDVSLKSKKVATRWMANNIEDLKKLLEALESKRPYADEGLTFDHKTLDEFIQELASLRASDRNNERDG